MRIFREVMTQQSFTRAAHALHLGVATVSEQISRLESEYGVRFFNRTTRKFSPTDAGQAMFDLCVRVLDDIERTTAGMADDSPELHGLVRIRVSDTLSQIVIIPHLRDLADLHPRIRIELLQDYDHFGRARGSADIVIRDVPPFYPLEKAKGILLGMTRTLFAASARYLAERGKPSCVTDLASHRCIGFIDPLSGRRWEWPILRDGIPATVMPEFSIAVTSPALLSDAVQADLGIALLLEYAVRDQLASGELVAVLPQLTFPHPVGILLRERGNQDAAVTAVAAFLCNRAKALSDGIAQRGDNVMG